MSSCACGQASCHEEAILERCPVYCDWWRTAATLDTGDWPTIDSWTNLEADYNGGRGKAPAPLAD